MFILLFDCWYMIIYMYENNELPSLFPPYNHNNVFMFAVGGQTLMGKGGQHT